MKQFFPLVVVLILLAAVSACQTELTDALGADATIQALVTQMLAETLAAEPPVVPPTVTPPTPSPPSAQDEPNLSVSGLIYADGKTDALWRWTPEEGSTQLSKRLYDVDVSPDGRYALHVVESDVWLLDLINGEDQNLTETPMDMEMDPMWSPNAADWVLFTYRSVDNTEGMGSGQIGLIRPDGSDRRILEFEHVASAPAWAPGGHAIAVDSALQPWLYYMESGASEIFDVETFGLSALKELKIGSPAWAPDGTKLAWWVGGGFESEWNLALAVFDFKTNTHQLLHPYAPLGGHGGWIPTPVWSPDGRWIAAQIPGETTRSDLWVLSTDGSEEHKLGFCWEPLWSPDGQFLAYSCQEQPGSESLHEILIVQVGEWTPKPMGLPTGSFLFDWIGN